jgi:hypothetical protein
VDQTGCASLFCDAVCEPIPSLPADRARYVMCGTFEPLPSPLMGEGSGGGEDRTSSPPSQPSPAKGGRGIDLPLSALPPGEGQGKGGRAGLYGRGPLAPARS